MAEATEARCGPTGACGYQLAIIVTSRMAIIALAKAEFANKKRKTRPEIFRERMDKLIPRAKLGKGLRKDYPGGENGRPPYPLPTTLREYCLQLLYNLSD